MKAYKVEILVVDFDQVGGDGIRQHMENVRYQGDTVAAEYHRLFGMFAGVIAATPSVVEPK